MFLTYNEFLTDAKWEIKKGNKKVSYIENEDYILLIGVYSTNLLIRFSLFKKNTYSYEENEKDITIIQLEKVHKTVMPVKIINGEIRIDGIRFEMEQRIPIYQIFDENYALEEIKDLEEIKNYRFDKEEDIDTIIKNLSEYVEYVKQEKEYEIKMKVNQ